MDVPARMHVCLLLYYGHIFKKKSAAVEILCFAPQTDTMWLSILHPGKPSRPLALTAYPGTPVKGWMPELHSL